MARRGPGGSLNYGGALGGVGETRVSYRQVTGLTSDAGGELNYGDTRTTRTLYTVRYKQAGGFAVDPGGGAAMVVP